MHIINYTKGKTIAENFEKCDTLLKQIRGLMFRRKVVPLVFIHKTEGRRNIHSFFCSGEIDLIFLNKHYEVVEIKPRWKSWSFYRPYSYYTFLLELPAGTISRTDTHIGDVIHFKEVKEQDQLD